MRKFVGFVASSFLAVLLVHCHGQYRPLVTADACACKTTEYCKVTPPVAGGEASLACAPLPVACGARPSCDCVGAATDAGRDEDGRLTVIPQRAVPACDACSADEYCLDHVPAAGGERFCRVLPPQCDATPTCSCFMESRGRSGKFTCDEHGGRIVASLMPGN